MKRVLILAAVVAGLAVTGLTKTAQAHPPHGYYGGCHHGYGGGYPGYGFYNGPAIYGPQFGGVVFGTPRFQVGFGNVYSGQNGVGGYGWGYRAFGSQYGCHHHHRHW
ncbi:MAG: hypothetical protein ACKV0T_01720 [Planctomycetales bacterium]